MAGGGLVRWIAGKILKLPPRTHGRIGADKGFAVPMRDGVTLIADRYYPADQAAGPVVVMRCPYGRTGPFGIMAQLLAERGFQAVVQSVRGVGGSGGIFDPMRQEAADGADTLAWIKAQPWYAGQLFTFGGSYLGNVQWAMASEAGDGIHGMALQVTLADFREELVGSGALTLAGTLNWTSLMQMLVAMKPGEKMKRPVKGALDGVFAHLPIGTIDQAAFGKTVHWWQDWVNHEDPEDPWWRPIDHRAIVPALAAPTTMVGGWQDIFLPFQIHDFAARQAAGRPAWLTIGAWTHAAPGGMFEGLRQAIQLFTALRDGRAPHAGRQPVRLFVQGLKQWREYPSWPPPGATPLTLHLGADGTLGAEPPPGVSTYVYDPADPTPSLHGPVLMGGAKVRDMSALDARGDTVSFTGAPLDRDTDVIGPVKVELSVRSDREHTDFFACLCEVDAKGRPLQICDGYIRLRPDRPAADASGVRRIAIDCWPTAYRFRRGNRIRVIVASGAFPRYARNLGTGEPMATATAMVTAHQEILHGVTQGSSITLSIVPAA